VSPQRIISLLPGATEIVGALGWRIGWSGVPTMRFSG